MSTKRIAMLGLLLSFALILSYIELLIPPIVPIPGMKIGLSNFILLVALFHYSKKESFLILIGKLILSSIFIGQGTSFMYSFVGGLISFSAMLCIVVLFDKKYVMLTSIIGAITHNLGQLLVAYFLIQLPSLFYYVPILFLTACITGSFIGILYMLIMPRITKL